MTAVVEMAFGIPAGSVPTDEDWVDVTEDVQADGDSVALTATTGASGDTIDRVTPGAVSFVLESKSGKYDPRNTAGPYFGQLVPGVPVRIRSVSSGGGGGESLYGLARFGVTRFGAGSSGTGAGPSLMLNESVWTPGTGWTTATDSALYRVDDAYFFYAVDSYTYGSTEPAWPDLADLGDLAYLTGFDDWSFGFSGGGTEFPDGDFPQTFPNSEAAGSLTGLTIYRYIERISITEQTADALQGYLYRTVKSLLAPGSYSAGPASPANLETDPQYFAWAPYYDTAYHDPGAWVDLSLGTHEFSGGAINSTSVVRWTGTVRTDWPQNLTGREALVEVEGEDTLGLASVTPMPASAFDAAMPADAVAWWRPSPDGWVDKITGKTGRHSSALVTGDPLVDGGDETWRSSDPGEGRATIEGGPWLDATGLVALSMWVRFDADAIQPDAVLFTQRNSAGVPLFEVGIRSEGEGYVRIGRTASGTAKEYTSWPLSPVRITDDRPHHLFVTAGWSAGDVRLYVDGVEVRLLAGTETAPASDTPTVIHIGGVPGGGNVAGAVDHVAYWDTPTFPIEATAVELTAAGRQAWAGDLLDERVGRILGAAGLADLTGTLDVSGIQTRQGYRTRPALELLQTVQDTEQGRVWCDPDGLVRFSARSWAWADSASTSVQATFSDVVAELAGGAFEMEEGSTIRFVPSGSVARAEVTSEYGRMQVAEDPVAAAARGPQEAISLSGLLHGSDRQSLAIAEWQVLSRSTEQIRAEITFAVTADTQVFADHVVPGWLVRVIKSPALDCTDTEVGDTIDFTGHVTGCRFEWTPFREYVTLTIDTTRTGYEFFAWDSTPWGGSAGWAF